MRVTRLLRQVASDILQQAGWIVLYGLAMTVALLPLGFVFPNLERALEETRAAAPYKSSDVALIRAHDLTGADSAREETPSGVSSRASLIRCFIESGRGGCCIVADGTGEFEQVIVFLGTYAEVVPLELGEDPLTLYVSADVASSHGQDTLEITGSTLRFEVLPADFCFWRLGYMMFGQSTWDFSRTLVACTHDFDIAMSLLGWDDADAEALGLLDGALCVGASDSELLELSCAAYDDGIYLDVIPSQVVLESSTGPGAGLYVAYLLLFGIAGVGLSCVALLNVHALIGSKLPTYAVCRLFGATLAETFARMVLLALSFQVLPAAVILLTGEVFLPGGLRLVVIALILAAVCSIAVTSVVYRSLVSSIRCGRLAA